MKITGDYFKQHFQKVSENRSEIYPQVFIKAIEKAQFLKGDHKVGEAIDLINEKPND